MRSQTSDYLHFVKHIRLAFKIMEGGAIIPLAADWGHWQDVMNDRKPELPICTFFHKNDMS